MMNTLKAHSGCCMENGFEGRSRSKRPGNDECKNGHQSRGQSEWNRSLASCNKWEVNRIGSAVLSTAESLKCDEGHRSHRTATASDLKELILTEIKQIISGMDKPTQDVIGNRALALKVS